MLIETGIVYVVYREGVYMQGMVGVYDDFEASQTGAIEAIRKEGDDYHTMCVVKMTLNQGKIEKVFEVSRTDQSTGMELSYEYYG